MPESASAVLAPLQSIVRWGFIILGGAAGVVAIALLVRRLTQRWRARTKQLADQLDRGLAVLHHTLAELNREADVYPPDTPDPYGPLVQALSKTLGSIEVTYTSLHAELGTLRATAQKATTSPWAKVASWLWHEPRDAWQGRTAAGRMVEALTPARVRVDEAKALLKELRKQPLEASKRVRELYELVEVAQHTVGDLQTAEVRGTPLDAADAALRTYRKTLHELPIYLFACTESQIVRRARPEEIAEAWATVAALEPAIRETAAQTTAWQHAYDTLMAHLSEMQNAVGRLADTLQATPAALDVSAQSDRVKALQAEARTLVEQFAAPRIEHLVDTTSITEVREAADELTTELGQLQADQTTLTSQIHGFQEMLTQTEKQLRQLAEAGRYPLDRVPLQAIADRLHQQADELGGPERQRTPPKLDAALKASRALVEQAQDLATQVSDVREQRRRFIELLDHQSESPQVDWQTWAQDLHARTHLYAEANWHSRNGKPGRKTPEREEAAQEDLRVHAIVSDAQALAESHRRWVPARVDDPLPPLELEQRIGELTALFAATEHFQDRLDQITQRFQVCRQMEEQAKLELATVYGALDQLDIVAADVLPPGLAKENNHWTRVREQLDEGYELELALSNPSTGTIAEKAARVRRWVEANQALLADWEKVLAAETETTESTLSAHLDDLIAIAPLGDEPAVVQARDAIERQALAPRDRRRRGRRQAQSAPSSPEAAGARVDDAVSEAAGTCAHLARNVAAQLRSLAELDRALATLQTDVLTPLAEPIKLWLQTEKRAEAAFADLQRLEADSARAWPPISCDTAQVQQALDRVDHLRDTLYQEGTTVSHVLHILDDLRHGYTEIVEMVQARDAAYHAQRPVLDTTLDQMERWCNALEAYRDAHDDDPVVAGAIRARLDEIEAGWTQLQIRYDQAPDLVPSDEAQRTLNDLWRQARRDLPIGPGLDILTAEEITAR